VGACALIVTSSSASAQPAAPASSSGPSPLGAESIARALAASTPFRSQTGQDQPAQEAPFRACPGCPERHLLRPYLESVGLHVLFNMGNRLRGHDTAKIGPRSWYANMKHGFEWDHNPFGVNQIGHPYQGSNFFTAGRANGLSFWESTSVAAFGSAAWEYYFENNRASLNDMVNTTVGGIALGEVLHRTGWLVRNPEATGRRRLMQEIAAAAIDPLTGMTRFLSGDASRVAEKPPDLVPSRLVARGSAGVLWQGSNIRSARSTARPFADVDLQYGDIRTGDSTTPFDAFTLGATLGGGSIMSEVVARGRYYGKSFGDDDRWQFTVLQAFDYLVNRAYVFGAQGFEAEIAVANQLSPTSVLRLSASGGASVLGAVNSLLEAPPGEGDPNSVFINPESRQYDYGPGFRIGGAINLTADRCAAGAITYDFYHVAVVDGFRSNHILQRLLVDVRLLRPERLTVGMAAEFFFRKAYFWVGSERTDQSPQFRVYLAWSAS
jgi:hypothetical protein